MTHLRQHQKLRQTRNYNFIQEELPPKSELTFRRVEPKYISKRNSSIFEKRDSISLLPSAIPFKYSLKREEECTHRGECNCHTSHTNHTNHLAEQSSLPVRHSITSRIDVKLEPLSTELRTRAACRNDFMVICAIGKGGFGKVWKVEQRKTMTIFAMKQMHKVKVIEKRSIASVINQRQLLAKVSHPFLINMTHAFQDRENLFLCMEYINGGDLRYHIGRKRKFNENETKFFLANIIIALQYLHFNGILHRDLKPENLVLEADGYLRLTDLGVSRELRENNANDTSGTPGYMAPEVMCRQNHSFGVDYFALGVIAYELMLGRRPYVGANRKEIREKILARQAIIKNDELPAKWSPYAGDFINKLLQRNSLYRLGANGIEEIKQHEWMRPIDWSKMRNKQIASPYTPGSIENIYDQYRLQISDDTEDNNPEQNALMLMDKEVQTLFAGYSYEAKK